MKNTNTARKLHLSRKTVMWLQKNHEAIIGGSGPMTEETTGGQSKVKLA
jgi:hypothetical protein